MNFLNHATRGGEGCRGDGEYSEAANQMQCRQNEHSYQYIITRTKNCQERSEKRENMTGIRAREKRASLYLWRHDIPPLPGK